MRESEKVSVEGAKQDWVRNVKVRCHSYSLILFLVLEELQTGEKLTKEKEGRDRKREKFRLK